MKHHITNFTIATILISLSILSTSCGNDPMDTDSTVNTSLLEETVQNTSAQVQTTERTSYTPLWNSKTAGNTMPPSYDKVDKLYFEGSWYAVSDDNLTQYSLVILTDGNLTLSSKNYLTNEETCLQGKLTTQNYSTNNVDFLVDVKYEDGRIDSLHTCKNSPTPYLELTDAQGNYYYYTHESPLTATHQ